MKEVMSFHINHICCFNKTKNIRESGRMDELMLDHSQLLVSFSARIFFCLG